MDRANRQCPSCHATLKWVSRGAGGFNFGEWHGHSDECPVKNIGPPPEVPDAVVGLEDVIGPNGAQLWEVTASVGRVAGTASYATDTFHVRAVSYDGALCLAREVRLYIKDAEATRVDE